MLSLYQGRHRSRSRLLASNRVRLAALTAAGLTVLAVNTVGVTPARTNNTVSAYTGAGTISPSVLFRNVDFTVSRQAARIPLTPASMKTSTPDSVPAVTAGGTVEDTADGVTGVNKWQRQEDVRKTQKLAAQLAEEARVARAKAAAERAKAVRTAEVAARRAETIKAAEQAATARANAAATAKARAGTPVLPASPGVKAWAGAQLTAMGYGPEQFTCLDHLFTRESGWNPLADNPNSDAYGIPQALPGSKMASAGPDWPTNPQTQIRWGLGYINARYGSPCLAWDHSQKHNWY